MQAKYSYCWLDRDANYGESSFFPMLGLTDEQIFDAAQRAYDKRLRASFGEQAIDLFRTVKEGDSDVEYAYEHSTKSFSRKTGRRYASSGINTAKPTGSQKPAPVVSPVVAKEEGLILLERNSKIVFLDEDLAA